MKKKSKGVIISLGILSIILLLSLVMSTIKRREIKGEAVKVKVKLLSNEEREAAKLRIPPSDEEVTKLKKEVELNPDSAHARDVLCSAYWQRGEINLAIKEAEESVRLSPDDAQRHFMLGDCYSKKGLLDEAIYEYEKAISLGLPHSMFYSILAEAYWKKGMMKEALAALEKAEKVEGKEIFKESIKDDIKKVKAGVPYVERYLGIPDEQYVSLDKKDPYSMALAVGHYRAKEKKEPANLEELVGTYIAEVRKDGWGTPYKLDSNKNAIVSAGKDKRFGTKDDEISYPIPEIRISKNL